MSQEEISLNPPASIAPDKAKRMSFDMAKSSKLSDEKMAELEKEVKRVLQESATNTQTMRKRLNVLNDMLEGVVEQVDSPFLNSSNTDVKMAIGTARTLRSTMVRALFPDPDRAFVASISDDKLRENANVIEDSFNWKAAHENNLIEALKDAVIPVFRDGTAFLQGVWERNRQKVIDYKSYLTPEEFLADYQEPKDAGIGEDKFTEILEHLTAPDASLDVSFEHEMTMKDTAAFSMVATSSTVNADG